MYISCTLDIHLKDILLKASDSHAYRVSAQVLCVSSRDWPTPIPSCQSGWKLEADVLGKEFQPEDQIAWSKNLDLEDANRPNVVKLTSRADQLADQLREELAGAKRDR